MNPILSKFGTYTNHIATLSEDHSVNSVDRAKLKGYHKKWVEAKYILGCAVFVDLLSPCLMFSRAMQNDEIDILGALTGVLQTLKETNRLASKGIEQWPTYAATMRKIVLEGKENDSAMYQCQELKNYSGAASFYTSKYAGIVVQCIKSILS